MGSCARDRITHCARLIVSCFRWRISRPTPNDSRPVYWMCSGPCTHPGLRSTKLLAHRSCWSESSIYCVERMFHCHSCLLITDFTKLSQSVTCNKNRLRGTGNRTKPKPDSRQNLWLALTRQNKVRGWRPTRRRPETTSLVIWIPRSVF